MPHKRSEIQVLVRFTPPTGADFTSIRDFIINELESGGGNRHPSDPLFHSLTGVKVSKPISPWRDPGRKEAKPVAKIVRSFPTQEP